jgi:hypothetical protein
VIQVYFTLFALIGATVHLGLVRARRSSAVQVAETYLLWFLVVYVGVMGVLTAYAHVYRPVQTSASIGWTTSPYEYEVGMADLTMGVLGLLCARFRGNFWLATAIGNAVWFLGDAVGHVRQMQLHGNHAENNAGIFLVLEFAVPVLTLALAFFVRSRTKEIV